MGDLEGPCPPPSSESAPGVKRGTMLEDIVHHLSSCQSALCLGWHAALATGGLAFGLWLAQELWGRTNSPTGASPESVAQESKPNGPTPEATPEAIPEAIPEATPEATPETIPEAIPEAESQEAGPLKTYLRAVTTPNSEAREELFAAAMAAMGLDAGPSRATAASTAALAINSPLVAPKLDYHRDLTLVKRINRSIERGLGEEGISSLEDLVNVSSGRLRDVAALLSLAERPEQERWQDQARELLRHIHAISGVQPYQAPRQVAPELLAEWFAGEPLVVHEQLGPVFDAMPLLVDRLTEIEGVSLDTAIDLGRMGIWRFKQIALWTTSQVDEVAHRLGIARSVIDFGAWIPRAMLRHLDSYRGSRIWASAHPEGWRYEELLNQYPASHYVQADPHCGVLYLERPDSVDNLTCIQGIDATMADSLRKVGVHRFRQIADWSEGNVDAFTVLLKLVPGRIYSERWIHQANSWCEA